MFNFNRQDPKTELEGLDKAMEILQQRYEAKTITLEDFSKKCEEIGKKRAKAMKRLEKENR